MKRTNRHEPTPEETLGYIADAVQCCILARMDLDPADTPHTATVAAITLGEIRAEVAKTMAANGEYFTSDYRHANEGLHEAVYRILGGTVSLNDLIETMRKSARNLAEVR